MLNLNECNKQGEKTALRRPLERLTRSRKASIRLKIEVPIISDEEEENDDLYEERLSRSSDRKRTPSIHLHISVNRRSMSGKRNRSESIGSSVKRPSSSGYSSENSSSLWSSCVSSLSSDQSESEFKTSQDSSLVSMKKNSQIYDRVKKFREESWNSEEKIYDRLSYSGKARNSVASSISSVKSVHHGIYEEIMVYESLNSCGNQSSKEIRNRFKREYTVNEIFQNLKSFKEAAREFERPGEKKSETVPEVKEENNSMVDKNREIVEENRQRLKQLINNSNKIATLTRNASSSSSTAHLYENEKLFNSINV